MNQFNNGAELNIEESEQDKIISQLIFDGNFLDKMVRSDVSPDLFTSEIRQKVVDFIYAYHTMYQEAPGGSITDILGPNPLRISIREDDLETSIDYISRTIQIKNTPGVVRRITDKILDFKKKQILANTISRLTKMKDQIDGSPEKMERVLNDSVSRLNKSESFAKTETIFDNEGYDEGDRLTCFAVPEIDAAIGGGLFAPNLVIIQAFTGRGKTWSVTHLIKQAARLGNDSTVLETEMANKKFKSRMRMCLTGMTAFDIRQNMNFADKFMRDSLVRGAQINIIGEEWKMGSNTSVDLLKPMVEEIEDRTGREQRLIFIDSPDDLEAPTDIICRSEIEKSKAIFTWLRNYTQDENKCVVVTCQSQRAAEKLLWTTSGNIGDDINKVRRATIGISINGSKNEVDANFTRLLVFKNTHGPEMKACWLYSDFEKGQWIQESGPIKRLNIDDYRQMLTQRGIKLGNGEGGMS